MFMFACVAVVVLKVINAGRHVLPVGRQRGCPQSRPAVWRENSHHVSVRGHTEEATDPRQQETNPRTRVCKWVCMCVCFVLLCMCDRAYLYMRCPRAFFVCTSDLYGFPSAFERVCGNEISRGQKTFPGESVVVQRQRDDERCA